MSKGSKANTIRAIAVLKLLKAAALVAIGIGLFHVAKDGFAANLAHSLRSPVVDRAANAAVDWLGSLSPAARWLLDIGTFLYAALFGVEGVGLWMRKRWAEWLTVISTALLIPLEIYEIIHKPTWERVLVLILNVAIAVYLALRLRMKE